MAKKKLFMQLTSTTRGRCRYIKKKADRNTIGVILYFGGKIETKVFFNRKSKAIYKYQLVNIFRIN